MRKITKDELNEILELHELWLLGEEGGKKADLSCTDLSGLNLSHMNLSGIDFSCAILRNTRLYYSNLSNANLAGVNARGASFHHSNLSNTNLFEANLYDALMNSVDLSNSFMYNVNLHGADLHGANLSNADLSHANLYSTRLSKANLSNADLSFANLSCSGISSNTILHNVKFNGYTSGYNMIVPEEGSFVGYTKVDDKIVVLEITEDAKRYSGTKRFCKCSKAKVLRIEDLQGNILDLKSVFDEYDKDFIYTVGEIIESNDFIDDRWADYPCNIQFFITKQEAINC